VWSRVAVGGTRGGALPCLHPAETAAFASPTEVAWFRLSPASGTWPVEPAVDEAEAVDRILAHRRTHGFS
jgi:hypothetical protein